jgi:hypothetical protein
MDKNEALREVGLGLDAEVFMESDLGREFLDVIQQRAITAMDELKKLKPGDFTSVDQFIRRVQDLQNEIDRVESFEEWMVEVVETGRNTEENLLINEAEEN